MYSTIGTTPFPSTVADRLSIVALDAPWLYGSMAMVTIPRRASSIE